MRATCGVSTPRLARLSSARRAEFSRRQVDLHQRTQFAPGIIQSSEKVEAEMKVSIALSALLITAFVAAGTEKASAVVYCEYVEYPAGCVAKPRVVLLPRPVEGVTPGVGAPGVGVRPEDRPVERPVDRPVDRVVRR